MGYNMGYIILHIHDFQAYYCNHMEYNNLEALLLTYFRISIFLLLYVRKSQTETVRVW